MSTRIISKSTLLPLAVVLGSGLYLWVKRGRTARAAARQAASDNAGRAAPVLARGHKL